MNRLSVDSFIFVY